MRIRNMKPEFWRSQDITSLPRELRLLFVGLWSYADDNGVGVDDYRQITADLFALEDDLAEARDFVEAGLVAIAARGLITRYELKGKRYLFVNTWVKHQRVQNPNLPRYPLPNGEIARPDKNYRGSTEGVGRVYVDPRTTTNRTDPDPTTLRGSDAPAENGDLFSTSGSVDPTETLGTGTEEQRNRGTEIKDMATAVADRDLFDDFWSEYPRKVGKPAARKAWAKACKAMKPKDGKTSGERLVAAARYWTGAWERAGTQMQYIPYPQKWLNQERWNDDPPPPKLRAVSGGHVPFRNPENQDDYDLPLG